MDYSYLKKQAPIQPPAPQPNRPLSDEEFTQMGGQPAPQPQMEQPLSDEQFAQMGGSIEQPQEEDGFFNSLAKTIAKPLARLGVSAQNVIRSGLGVSDYSTPQDLAWLGEVKPLGGEGTLAQRAKDVAGNALENASLLVGGGAVKGATSIGGKMLKGAIEGAKAGAKGGAMYGAGSEMENPDSTATSIFNSTLGGGAGGLLGGGALGGAFGAVIKTPQMKNSAVSGVGKLRENTSRIVRAVNNEATQADAAKARAKLIPTINDYYGFGDADLTKLAKRDINPGEMLLDIAADEGVDPFIQDVTSQFTKTGLPATESKVYQSVQNRIKDNANDIDSFLSKVPTSIRAQDVLSDVLTESKSLLKEGYSDDEIKRAITKFYDALSQEFKDRGYNGVLGEAPPMKLDFWENVKRGRWSQAFQPNKTANIPDSEIEYIFGNAIKKRIMNEVSDPAERAALQNVLDYQGELLSLRSQLDKRNLKAPGSLGQLSWKASLNTRLLGNSAAYAAFNDPFTATVIGVFGSEMAEQVMKNPSIRYYLSKKVYPLYQAGKVKEAEEALSIIKDVIVPKSGRKLLEAPGIDPTTKMRYGTSNVDQTPFKVTPNDSVRGPQVFPQAATEFERGPMNMADTQMQDTRIPEEALKQRLTDLGNQTKDVNVNWKINGVNPQRGTVRATPQSAVTTGPIAPTDLDEAARLWIFLQERERQMRGKKPQSPQAPDLPKGVDKLGYLRSKKIT